MNIQCNKNKQAQETLAMLKMIAQSEQSIKDEKIVDARSFLSQLCR